MIVKYKFVLHWQLCIQMHRDHKYNIFGWQLGELDGNWVLASTTNWMTAGQIGWQLGFSSYYWYSISTTTISAATKGHFAALEKTKELCHDIKVIDSMHLPPCLSICILLCPVSSPPSFFPFSLLSFLHFFVPSFPLFTLPLSVLPFFISPLVAFLFLPSRRHACQPEW